MTSVSAIEPSTPFSQRYRVLTLVMDGITGLVVVAVLAALVVVLSTDALVPSLSVVSGVWTAFWGLLSLPALAILSISKPRVPLRDRSALAASASWFGRVIFSAVVFALSIVVGSVAGVVASNATGQGDQLSAGLKLAVTTLGATVFWPTVLCAAAIAFVVMGTRWCIDLGDIVNEERGARLRSLIEHRWAGQLETSQRSRTFYDFVIEIGVSLISRVAMIITLITIGLSLALFVSGWSIWQ